MCSKVLSLYFILKESSQLGLHLLIALRDGSNCCRTVSSCPTWWFASERLNDFHKTARSNVCFCPFHDRSRQVKDVVRFQRLEVLGDSALQAVQLAV